MSDDGAELGYTAEQGLKAVMGHEQKEPERITPEELRARLHANPGDSYSQGSNLLALGILRVFEQRPETVTWPADPRSEFFVKGTDEVATGEQIRAHPESLDWRRVDDRDLSEAFKTVATPEEMTAYEGCTGFMWGWAVNAAKYVVGAPPVANPAIIEIGNG